jgi:hypothetical protein
MFFFSSYEMLEKKSLKNRFLITFLFLLFSFKTLEYYVCEQEKFEKLAATDEYEFFYQEKLGSIRKK